MDDLIVISDLHMGRGSNPRTGRYFNLEAFFYDEDFCSFCDYLCRDAEQRQTGFKLILNGDVFDLLRIEPGAVGEGASPAEKRYGQPITPSVAADLVEQILRGHPKFVQGVAEVLLAGHEVIFLPGNHDIEIQWPQVQHQVRRYVLECIQGETDDDGEIEEAVARLRFLPWFYHEPGRVWIEHGCQYDPENSFRFLLRSGVAGMPDGHHATEQDLPLGNFIQRYLYNAFGHITFVVPSTRANFRYLRWLFLNQPRLLMGVLFSHGPFAFQVLRRLGAAAAIGARRALRRNHHAELSALAESTGLGEKLIAIDKLKKRSADVVQGARALGWQLTKAIGGAAMLVLLSTALWSIAFWSINHLRAGLGAKTLLFLTLNFFAVTAVLSAAAYVLLRSAPSVPASPLRKAAQSLAEVLGVSVISFGHTHEENIWALAHPHAEADAPATWYFNTGTWIAVFTHDVLVPRERVQFTYLSIRDHRGELLRWSPTRQRALPVVLLESG